MKYEKLFSRGKIGRVTLKNRVVLPAMGSQMVGVSCEANDAVIRYFEARAKGGCGLIMFMMYTMPQSSVPSFITTRRRCLV